jgi:hypothetical protein
VGRTRRRVVVAARASSSSGRACYARNGRRDILAANRLGYALYSVGDLHLSLEAMDLRADPGLSVVAYSAEPGSTFEDGLSLLVSWSATLDQAEVANPTQATEPLRLEKQGVAKIKRSYGMRGAILYAPGDVRCEEHPDPMIMEPTDAIVHRSSRPQAGRSALRASAPLNRPNGVVDVGACHDHHGLAGRPARNVCV